MKKIINIVFYKTTNDKGMEEKRACIFYKDGSVEDVSYIEAIDACETIVKERKINSKKSLKELINNKLIYVMSEEALRENFNSFTSQETLAKEYIEESINEEMDNIKDNQQNNSTKTRNTIVAMNDEINVEDYIDTNKKEINIEDYINTNKEEINVEDYIDTNKENINVEDYITVVPAPTVAREIALDELEDTEKAAGNTSESSSKKRKKSRIGVKIAAIGAALLVATGLFSCATRKSKEGQIDRNNISTTDTNVDDNTNDKLAFETLDHRIVVERVDEEENNDKLAFESIDRTTVVRADNTNNNMNQNTVATLTEEKVLNNDDFNGYSYEQLLEVTTNEFQKNAMKNLGDTIQAFNGPFADAYVEEGKDIRAALSFDELVALQQAYNEYSKEEIQAYFNGAEIRADKLTRAYKDASLQLMGAYVIETRENPVDMSGLIDSEEGKAFYNRYHEMFLAMKEATGEEKLAKVAEFYKAVREDFPITEVVRTEGIAHADDYGTITAYKLSVTPMIAAAEMMYQNLSIDYTLNDSQIDFLNDIGLCNYAEHTFERIETITLTMAEDETNPTFEQYRQAIIDMMVKRNQYVIDDEHRELTKLDAFQNAVNWHFDMVSDYTGNYDGYYYEGTQTWTEVVEQWTEEWTEETVVTEVIYDEEIPQELKDEIDAQIEQENEIARAEAEAEAEAYRQQLQDYYNQQAEQIYQEIREEEQDLQDRIEDANEQIQLNQDNDPTNDKPINESDFGYHDVDFFDDYSDENGNLDNSVENLTTDPTGDQTGMDLPDPNETGAIFDQQYVEYENPYTPIEETNNNIPVNEDTYGSNEEVNNSNNDIPVNENTDNSNADQANDEFDSTYQEDYSNYENYEEYDWMSDFDFSDEDFSIEYSDDGSYIEISYDDNTNNEMDANNAADYDYTAGAESIDYSNDVTYDYSIQNESNDVTYDYSIQEESNDVTYEENNNNYDYYEDSFIEVSYDNETQERIDDSVSYETDNNIPDTNNDVTYEENNNDYENYEDYDWMSDINNSEDSFIEISYDNEVQERIDDSVSYETDNNIPDTNNDVTYEEDYSNYENYEEYDWMSDINNSEDAYIEISYESNEDLVDDYIDSLTDASYDEEIEIEYVR